MSVTRCRPVGLCERECDDAVDRARDWQRRAAEFADEVVHPLALALDRLPCSAVLAPHSALREFIAEAHWEGFTRLTDASGRGGAGLSRTAEYAVLEQLAAADAGLAALLIATPLPFRWAHAAGVGSLEERVGRPFFAACAPDRSGCLLVPTMRGQLRVRRAGHHWLLSGSSAAPAVAAGVATHAAIVCAVDGPGRGHAVAIVPLDRAGVERRAVDLVGLRPAASGVLELHDVRLEADELITQHGHADAAVAVAATDHLTAAIACVGIARCACDGAARWVAERCAASARRIGPMRVLLERTRGLTRAAHRSTHARLDAGERVATEHAAFARVLASRTASELARQALWIVGSGGLAAEGVEHLDGSRFRPEKLLRDAYELSLTRSGAASASPQRLVNSRAEGSAQWGL
jgi:alkylation response protein AidB-like acyl-CoA dehydrogenase